MFAFNRFWVPVLVLLFVSAGACLSQDTINSFDHSAVRLLAGLNRESHSNLNARTAIVRWYCEKGKYQEAAKQTTTLELNDRISLLAFIALTAGERKDRPAATKILASAWSALAADKDGDVDTVYTEQLAQVAARNQDLDLALKFAARLDEGSLRKSSVLLTIARSHIEPQGKKEVTAFVQLALKQIEGFGEDERNDEFEIKISAASILASIGEIGRANELAGEVQTALLAQAEPNVRDKTALAELFADLGDLPRAIGIVETLDGDDRVGALMSLSQHCKVGAIERSLLDRARDELLSDSSDDYASSLSISKLVPVFLRAGRIDDSVELLNQIKDPYHLHRSAIAVANVLADQQRIDDAEAALNIASRVGRKIVSEKSEDIPSHSSSSQAQTKSQVLRALVDSYIKLGKLASAELDAGAIDHPQYRALAMSKIGVGYANIGERTKARAILMKALTLSDTSEDYRHDCPREYGLFGVIEALTEVGSASAANKAMARLLTLVKNGESGDQYAGELFVLARLFESRGLSSTKKVDDLFKQIEVQQNGDN
jgi:tetratricopeptide (TPR) repeat protein